MANTRSSGSPVSINTSAWPSGTHIPRELRDIEACLRVQASKLYHLGIRSHGARNTLANATRDWRIYCELGQSLIATARRLYATEPFGLDLKETVYALDATTIDLCLSVFPWAPFRATNAAIKLHTLLDLRGNIPSFIFISDGKLHEVNVLAQLVPEPGAFYVMDRGYLDFERLGRYAAAGSFFVLRAQSNLNAQRRYSQTVDRRTGLICDQTVGLTGLPPQGLRRAVATNQMQRPRVGQDAGVSDQQLRAASTHDHEALPTALANRVVLQVEQVASSYQAFFGTSENAVKTPVWIAVSVYVLVAIVKKRLALSASLYEILPILSLTMFKRIPLDQLLLLSEAQLMSSDAINQLNLFE